MAKLSRGSNIVPRNLRLQCRRKPGMFLAHQLAQKTRSQASRVPSIMDEIGSTGLQSSGFSALKISSLRGSARLRSIKSLTAQTSASSRSGLFVPSPIAEHISSSSSAKAPRGTPCPAHRVPRPVRPGPFCRAWRARREMTRSGSTSRSTCSTMAPPWFTSATTRSACRA